MLSVCALEAVMPWRVALAHDDPRNDASPWGIAAGADSGRTYARFTPALHQAGIKWLRLFPEWQNIQPKQGQWDWDGSDKLVANARANHIHLMGIWCYFAPWASADGGTRKGPIKDMQYWRDYVSATVRRYQSDIKYWEVWNEFDGSFYEGRQGADKVKDYANFVVAAYDAAKKLDPNIQIGTCVGPGFLDLVINQVHADTTVPVSSGSGVAEDCRRTDFSRSDKEGHYVYFAVDPRFVPYGTRGLQISILAKRVAPDKTAGMSLCYESAKGYKGAQGYWTIPGDNQWHEYTWNVNDANFANEWGWNFRFDAIGSPNEFLMKKVRVTKAGQPGN